MMLWLHDQGLNPLPEANLGGLRADMLDSGRLIVEAKRYSEDARMELVTGVRELRDHALRLAGTTHFVREAFYVVFREGGPLYQLPEEIRFTGLTIVPVVIDIGANDEAGSRQPRKVIPISDEEFLHVDAP
jgi:hypothetical protein